MGENTSVMSNFKEDVESMKENFKQKQQKLKKEFERKIYLKNKTISELNK